MKVLRTITDETTYYLSDDTGVLAVMTGQQARQLVADIARLVDYSELHGFMAETGIWDQYEVDVDGQVFYASTQELVDIEEAMIRAGAFEIKEVA